MKIITMEYARYKMKINNGGLDLSYTDVEKLRII